MPMSVARLVVVAGPTATGKSDLALDLAGLLDGEIVNADSMQLYRGMDIGTAKVPVAERRGIPHHQLDVLPVSRPASVAAYQERALADIRGVLERGRTPVLVGGSGLYIAAVLDELSFPPTDPVIRERWQRELDEHGESELHRRLAEVDPRAAATIEPGNGRRLVRALEVVELTGRPFGASMPTPGPPRFDAVMLLLDRPTDELDQLLERRVHAMVDGGLLGEVQALDAIGLRDGVTASRALGYRQFLDVIDGTRTVAEAITDTVSGTRRFVRRQRSWFRRDPRWRPVTGGSPELLAEALQAAKGGPTIDV